MDTSDICHFTQEAGTKYSPKWEYYAQEDLSRGLYSGIMSMYMVDKCVNYAKAMNL